MTEPTLLQQVIPECEVCGRSITVKFPCIGNKPHVFEGETLAEQILRRVSELADEADATGLSAAAITDNLRELVSEYVDHVGSNEVSHG
jgi:hypothetical protein